MCNCICNEDNEEIAWRWADKIGEIRDKMEAQTPEYLDRYDDLVWLRARLMDYTEAIEATILGYDPDDPGPEAVFGDTTLEETIEVMATLPTVPADVNRLLESIRESSDNGGEPQSGQAATSYIYSTPPKIHFRVCRTYRSSTWRLRTCCKSTLAIPPA